jgi:outer membrane protein assembly factor BamB
MMNRRNRTIALPCALAPAAVLLLAVTASSAAADWPQFRGENRDGISRETGLDADWTDGEPAVLWTVKLGKGFSGLSVADGRLFTMFSDGSDEYVGAFDVTSGDSIWRFRIDQAYSNSFGDGPRSTPTVDGGVVFAVSARGTLAALDAERGKLIWNRDLVRDVGAVIPEWGISTSPTIDGERLLINAGGSSNRSILALDKTSGELQWGAFFDGAGYSTPILIDAAGRRQAVFLTSTNLVGVDRSTGDVLWSQPWKTQYDVNAAMPIFVAPDKVFVSTGYGTGAALFKLTGSGGPVAIAEVWRTRGLKNQFSSSVLVDGQIYGFDDSILKSISASDGAENWRARGFGHGSLFYADGLLVVLGDKGRLALVGADPDSFTELASRQLFQAKAWTVPTLSNGMLFVRNETNLMALDVASK